MREVVLHGSLGERFGERFEFHAPTAIHAVKLLECNFPGFMEAIRDGEWRICIGKPEDGLYLDDETLNFEAPHVPLHIIPMPKGSKNKGLFGILLGIVIIGAAIAFAPGAIGAIGAGGASFGTAMGATAFSLFGTAISFGAVALVGAAMVLGGIASLLAPTPKVNAGDTQRVESFFFEKAENTIGQGMAVPLIYGTRFRVGSVTISGSVVTETLSSTQTTIDYDQWLGDYQYWNINL